MKNTTLCYLEKDGQYLMLFRNRKKNDLNAGKWVGVGGKFEEGESPDDCLLREVREETGLTLTRYRCRGVVTFVSDRWEGEYMHLFTADGFTGTMSPCDEGDLAWVDIARVPELPLWEGDRIFLRLLAENRPFFSLKLVYEGDMMTKAVLDGKEVPAPDAGEIRPKKNLLVSACLLGLPCRYDGLSRPCPGLEALWESCVPVPVCPEVLGGLPTPRVPAERQEGRVAAADGRDVTDAYRKGAEETLRIAELTGCRAALLKEKSPSCGSGRIYDGTFTRTVTGGDGVTAALLKEHGVAVFGESEFEKLL